MTRLLFLLAACHAAAPVGTLTGRVILDGESDASGVSVVATGPASAATLSDPGGKWTLPNLPAGAYALTFSAESTREHTRALELLLTGGAAAPDVHFTPVGSLHGSVNGQASVFVEGAGVSGAADGSYLLEAVPTGSWTVGALAPGFQLATVSGVQVVRGQTAEAPPLTLVADGSPAFPTAPLSGVALRLGRSDHSGTTVTALAGATQLSAQTAGDGSYHFAGVPSGVYSLRFDYDGHSETLPQVLALGGTEGQIIDGALYPLPDNPISLPEARRAAPADNYRRRYIIDHDHLVIADADPDGSDLLLRSLSLADGSATTLDGEVVDFFPYLVLSADRRRILYETAQGPSLRVIGSGGGAPLTLGPFIDNFQQAGFSLDGAFVLYPDQSHGGAFSAVPSSGGAVTPLFSGPVAYLLHPDGKRVLYQWCNGSDCRVSIRALDGQDTPLDLLTNAKGAPQLTADGAWVVMVSNWSYPLGPAQILAAATDGSGSRTLWDGMTQQMVLLSPDSRHVALFTDSQDLRSVDLGSPADPVLIAGGVTGAAFAGPNLLYTGAETEASQAIYYFPLTQQPAGGGAPLPLADKIERFLVAPDGSATLFTDNLDFSTGKGRLVAAGSTGTLTVLAQNVYNFVWTADSAHVLFLVDDPVNAGGYLVQSLPPSGGAPVTLAPATATPSWAFPSTLQLSPSGSSVTVSDDQQLVRVTPVGGGASLAAGFGSATWIDDTRLLLEEHAQPPFSFQTGLYVWDVTP